jgi:hypothetical protein
MTKDWNSSSSTIAVGGGRSGVTGELTNDDGCLDGGDLDLGGGGALWRGLLVVDILAEVQGLLLLLLRFLYCSCTHSTIRCTASPSRGENWESSVLSCSTQ